MDEKQLTLSDLKEIVNQIDFPENWDGKNDIIEALILISRNALEKKRKKSYKQALELIIATELLLINRGVPTRLEV